MQEADRLDISTRHRSGQVCNPSLHWTTSEGQRLRNDACRVCMSVNCVGKSAVASDASGTRRASLGIEMSEA